MVIEIERRFIVEGEDWRKFAESPQEFRQGYLASEINGWNIRIRILGKEKALLTLKIKTKSLLANHEFEYEIPMNDAENIWKMTTDRIYKTRSYVHFSNKKWVIDCFQKQNHPLVIAEIELNSEEEIIEIPKWCIEEITGQYQWSNASLAKSPINIFTIEDRLLEGSKKKGHSLL